MKNLLTLRHIVEFCLFLGTVAGADTDTKTVPTVAGEDSDAKTLPTVEDKDPDSKTVPTRTNLKSVFNSCSLTFLYETIRKQAVPLESSLSTEPIDKDAICQKIASSHFFFANNYVPINIEEAYMENGNLDMFSEIFQKSKDEKLKELFSTDNNYVYTNPYYPVTENVIIREDDQPHFHVDNEYVFTCLVKDCRGDTLKAFYITKEYNTADNEHSNQNVAGRFIFEGDKDKELSLIALAEEPAKILYGKMEDQVALEQYYLKLRSSQPPDTKWDDKKPFCERIERTRLCSSIYAGMSELPQYRNKLHARTFYEPLDCFMKEVSFVTNEAREEIKESGEKYYELMVYCEAEQFDLNEEENCDEPRVLVRFFVSRAYNQNQVFVYSVGKGENPDCCLSNGKAYLENLSTNLGIGVY